MGSTHPPDSFPDSLVTDIEPLTRVVAAVVSAVQFSTISPGIYEWFTPVDRKGRFVDMAKKEEVDELFNREAFAEKLASILSASDDGRGIARTGDINVITLSNDLISCMERAVYERAQTLPREFLHGQVKDEFKIKPKNAPDSLKRGLLHLITDDWIQQVLVETKK
jgi:hypothetical protein